MQDKDFLEALREQERILGEMRSSVHRWMDELLRTAWSPETLLGIAASMGIYLPHVSDLTGQQDDNDPYRIIGLERTATDEEVKKRYRELLFILHPDTATAPGTETMLQQLISAYQKIAHERRW
ncbi:MAG: J domain-containing protein [Dehalococcoidales bacterium]|nr:J domain-containing protein [Dehalococcoidales bacterium]